MIWPLAFSTLGCPGRPLAEVATLARSSGWSLVELCAARDEPVHIGLSTAERGRAYAELTAGGAVPLAIASYVNVADDAIDDDGCVEDALAHALLAADLGCGFVRALPGAARAHPRFDSRAVRRLKRIAGELPDGVDLLIETHDSHARGADLARILGEVDDPRIGAVWDVLHPWRAGEPPADTFAALRPWLRHVQIKDVRSAVDPVPVYLGTGTVPLADVLAELAGYAGPISLEWEAKWHPGLPPLADALARGHTWLEGCHRNS